MRRGSNSSFKIALFATEISGLFLLIISLAGSACLARLGQDIGSIPGSYSVDVGLIASFGAAAVSYGSAGTTLLLISCALLATSSFVRAVGNATRNLPLRITMPQHGEAGSLQQYLSYRLWSARDASHWYILAQVACLISVLFFAAASGMQYTPAYLHGIITGRPAYTTPNAHVTDTYTISAGATAIEGLPRPWARMIRRQQFTPVWQTNNTIQLVLRSAGNDVDGKLVVLTLQHSGTQWTALRRTMHWTRPKLSLPAQPALMLALLLAIVVGDGGLMVATSLRQYSKTKYQWSRITFADGTTIGIPLYFAQHAVNALRDGRAIELVASSPDGTTSTIVPPEVAQEITRIAPLE